MTLPCFHSNHKYHLEELAEFSSCAYGQRKELIQCPTDAPVFCLAPARRLACREASSIEPARCCPAGNRAGPFPPRPRRVPAPPERPNGPCQSGEPPRLLAVPPRRHKYTARQGGGRDCPPPRRHQLGAGRAERDGRRPRQRQFPVCKMPELALTICIGTAAIRCWEPEAEPTASVAIEAHCCSWADWGGMYGWPARVPCATG